MNTRPGRGAERPRCSRQRRIDDLEGRDRRPEVERARDERHGEYDGDLRERDVDAESVEGPAEKPDTTEGDEEPDTGDRGRQHERQLDERHEGIA